MADASRSIQGQFRDSEERSILRTSYDSTLGCCTHTALTEYIREEMHTLSAGKIRLAACSDESRGHYTQYSMSYLVFRADDNEK